MLMFVRFFDQAKPLLPLKAIFKKFQVDKWNRLGNFIDGNNNF